MHPQKSNKNVKKNYETATQTSQCYASMFRPIENRTISQLAFSNFVNYFVDVRGPLVGLGQ